MESGTGRETGVLDPDVGAGAVEDAFVIQRHAVLSQSDNMLGQRTDRQSSEGAQGNIHAESDGEVCTERVLMHAFEVLRAPHPPIARDGVERPDQSPAECYNSGRGDQGSRGMAIESTGRRRTS